MAAGCDFSSCSPDSVWVRSSASSCSGKAGRTAASASSPNASAALRDSVFTYSCRKSAPAEAAKPPPTPSMAAANCSAFRAPAPLLRSPATMAASPTLPAGSVTAPAWKESDTAITGCLRFSTTSRRIPLGSTASWNGGNCAGASGMGAGGVLGKPCAASGAAAASRAPPARRVRVRARITSSPG